MPSIWNQATNAVETLHERYQRELSAFKIHAEMVIAALAQIEHIKTVIERSKEHMKQDPYNYAIAGDMSAIVERLNDVTRS